MYRVLNRCFYSFLLLATLNTAQAQTVSEALDLMSNGNYDAAYKILTQLAGQGDMVAQYNLGLMLKNGLGREQDNIQSQYWFSQAAKQGMASAYNQLQANTVKPGIGTHVEIVFTPEDWVKAQRPDYYTLQLASSTNRKLIEKYYLENNLQGKAGYYRNHRQGEDWYALVYGAYPSVSDANAAVAELPADLKKWSPWVRKFKVIQRLMDK